MTTEPSDRDRREAVVLASSAYGDAPKTWDACEWHDWVSRTADRIARAIAAARAVPDGHVRLSDGREPKVLVPSRGPRMHMTEDGAIVPSRETLVWSYEIRNPPSDFSGKAIQMYYGTWFDRRWDDTLPACWTDKAPDGKWGCYSTEQAAAAARGGER